MQSQNRIFDDLVKMMNGVAGTMAGVGREAESSMREKMREWVGGMDFVGRDEFEAVKAMARQLPDAAQTSPIAMIARHFCQESSWTLRCGSRPPSWASSKVSPSSFPFQAQAT